MILALIYSLLAEISFLCSLYGKRGLCHASKLALTVQSPSTQSRTQSPRAFWPAGERPERLSIFPENVGSGLMTYG